MNMPAPILPDAEAVAPAGAKVAAAAQAGVGEELQWDALVGPEVLPSGPTAAQAMAEAVAAGVAASTATPPASAYTVTRRLRQVAPASVTPGVSALHVVPAVAVGRLVERVTVAWVQNVNPPAGPDLFVAMFVTPANPSAANFTTSGPDPEWIGVDGAAVGPVASPSVSSPLVVFEPPSGYYLEAGKALAIFSYAPAVSVGVQWCELPAAEA